MTIVISGVGVTSAIGQGSKSFWESLVNGESHFSYMKREFRQNDSRFIGAEISSLRKTDIF